MEKLRKAKQFSSIIAQADRVFGDAQKSARWLSKPNRALAGQSPLQRLEMKNDVNDVEELLGQIDHGMPV